MRIHTIALGNHYAINMTLNLSSDAATFVPCRAMMPCQTET
jgi:hypothetical protein